MSQPKSTHLAAFPEEKNGCEKCKIIKIGAAGHAKMGFSPRLAARGGTLAGSGLLIVFQIDARFS